MKKVLCAIAMLAAGASANAAITTSIDGGTSYIHLGKLSAKECAAFLASPASASFKVALDGKIMRPDDGKCMMGSRSTSSPRIRSSERRTPPSPPGRLPKTAAKKRRPGY